MRVLILTALVLAFVGCGSGKAQSKMVWCVAPGEVVDTKFKSEYPELYMPREACEALSP
jgi:hypothetical protein